MRHAAAALGRLGPAARPAAEALAPLVVDPEPTVRRAAIRAWLRIRPDPKVAVPLLSKVLADADPAVRTGALEMMAQLGKPAVTALTEALKHEKTAYWACLAMNELGPKAAEATPILADVLRTNPRAEVRREAALAIGSIGAAAAPAVPALIEALGDKEPSVATGAAFALGLIGPQAAAATPALETSAQAHDQLLRTVSVWALAKLDPQNEARKQEAVAMLAAALGSKEPRVRHAAVHGLIDLNPGSKAIFPAIKKALDSADSESLEYALEALDWLGPPAVPALIDALRHEQIRPVVASILGHIGAAAKESAPRWRRSSRPIRVCRPVARPCWPSATLALARPWPCQQRQEPWPIPMRKFAIAPVMRWARSGRRPSRLRPNCKQCSMPITGRSLLRPLGRWLALIQVVRRRRRDGPRS